MKEQDFFKHIKQSLEEEPNRLYELEDWDEIEEQLDKKSKRRFGFFFKFGIGFLLLTIGFSWKYFEKELPSNGDISVVENPPINPSVVNKEELNSTSQILQNKNKAISTESIYSDKKGLTILNNENKTTALHQQLNLKTTSNTSTKKPKVKINNNIITKEKLNLFSNSTQLKKNKIVDKTLNTDQSKSTVFLANIPTLAPAKNHYRKDRRFSNRSPSIQSEYVNTISSGLKARIDPEEMMFSKRKMIGIYGGVSNLRNQYISHLHPISLRIGVRGRYFFHPKWNIDLGFSIIRSNNHDDESLLPPTPAYEYITSQRKYLEANYQVGLNYWFGNNASWQPYVGFSLVGEIVSISKFSRTYNNINTELEESIFSRRTQWGQYKYLTTSVNLKAGLMYRFKNPKFGCQLEFSHNQRFIDRDLTQHIINVTAGVFYYFKK